MPRYGAIDLKSARRVYDNLDIWFGPDRYRTNLYAIEGKTTFYFVDCPRALRSPGSLWRRRGRLSR